MSYIVEGRTVPDHLPPDIDLSLARPLDPSIYEADVEFLSAVTGIKDYEELKEHVLKVQADAYAVFPYPCIRNFAISNSKINTYPGYEDLLKLGKEREGAIYLEIACCVGNDVRRAILDGFPASQIVATDLIPGFWEVGHKLFKSIPESFPVKFLPGDFFDTSFFDPQAEVKGVAPDLSTLTNLTPLRGRISAIHTSSFFHLFDEERQLQVAHLLNALLSPQPGSIAFGAHGGLPEKGERIGSLQLGTTDQPMKMFCHSPETFKEMWEAVCGKEKVDIQVTLRDAPDRKDCMWTGNRKRYWLVWSVKRL